MFDMHGVSVADASRYACVNSGWSEMFFPLRWPYWDTISAATPTACGEAIDVPWIHW